MEPPEEVRRWVGDLVGLPVDDHLSHTRQAWEALEPALAAVHEAPIPAETEPAVRMLFPIVEDPASASSLGQQ